MDGGGARSMAHGRRRRGAGGARVAQARRVRGAGAECCGGGSVRVRGVSFARKEKKHVTDTRGLLKD